MSKIPTTNNTLPKKSLAAVVGITCCTWLLTAVPQFEGTILRGYKDPIGIVTACSGHTKTAVLGRPYSKAECTGLLDEDLVAHSEGVLKCTPVLAGKSNQLGAAISFAFNIGVRNYCSSTTARRFNAGDFAGACKAMNENDRGGQQWVSAGKKQKINEDGRRVVDQYGRAVMVPNVLRGLVTRRAAERALCETGL